jgi:signal transduction histidine kinase
VQGLVEQSGGTISIDTGPERGTTVTVTLPRATTARNAERNAKLAVRAGER